MQLMSGNEAIARGAWEAGATIGVAYPGTPSTETLESFAKYDDVYAEWCVNEKVAVEVGIGASAAGARVLSTMKHVGVNVAADPLFTAAYTGVNGGFVILAADDPGMYSSQNEQDSRYYAQAAHIPILDPSSAQEALDFTRGAYDISEEFDIPVMIRSTVRISHTKTVVQTHDKVPVPLKEYEKNPQKWVMMPAFAKPRRLVQLERIEKLKEWVEGSPYNKIVNPDQSIGVVCSGAAYQHVVEALPDVSIFKLGITYPLPANSLELFAESVDTLYVVDEASTYLSDAVRALGIEVSPFKTPLPAYGELTPRDILVALDREVPAYTEKANDIPNRPPALCPGCPHRLVFKELTRLKAIVTGDIGCYTLGALPPLSAVDTVVDMGASVSMSHGFELALKDTEHYPVVAVIGDSTFAHSGLSSLISTVYNQGSGTVCILDNRTTAMTGRQGNPFNGETLQHRESRELDLVALIESLGIENVSVVNPHNAEEVRATLKEATKYHADEMNVIIFKAPCVLLHRERQEPYLVNGSCIGCGQCISLGCPALSKDRETNIASIDPALCIGCGQCSQYCPVNAIEQLKQNR